jgi:hypothetical protein
MQNMSKDEREASVTWMSPANVCAALSSMPLTDVQALMDAQVPEAEASLAAIMENDLLSKYLMLRGLRRSVCAYVCSFVRFSACVCVCVLFIFSSGLSYYNTRDRKDREDFPTGSCHIVYGW